MKQGGFLKRKTPLKARTGFKASQKPLKRTQLKKVGKIGKANIEADKRLKTTLGDIDYCEVRLDAECLKRIYLTNAHRHKRSWYKGDVELLSDRKQVVIACVNCHNTMEFVPELTEEVFIRLRGEE